MVGRGVALVLLSECLKPKHILIAHRAVVGITYILVPLVFHFRTAVAAIAMGALFAINLDVLHIPFLCGRVVGPAVTFHFKYFSPI